METLKLEKTYPFGVCASALILLSLLVCSAQGVFALNLSVVDSTGTPIPSSIGFRWQIEEDKTYHVPLNTDGTVQRNGGVPTVDPNWSQTNTLSVGFHRSYMPLVAKGDQTNIQDLDLATLDPAGIKHFYISVLPGTGYALGGAQIKPGQTSVKVYVNENPIPTAQISIFVHEDTAPINNVWDEGEAGLAGFSIILEDAGGRYGASAGVQTLDAFGNPLCTTYNPDGSVLQLGAGCATGSDGRVTIKNLEPGKFGITVVPPTGPGQHWVQTSTIEGKKVIDAWVKPNEPPFFAEFGPPGPHVSIGFAHADDTHPYKGPELTGSQKLVGQIVNLHLSRPPATTFYLGGPFPHTTPWVGLNEMSGGVVGKGVYAAKTNYGQFEIPNVPPGQYQLVVWDDNLDLLFAQSTVTVTEDGCNGVAGCNLGDVGVFQWFHRMEHFVFLDGNDNNLWDEGEGIPEQNINLRWRDGTIYQSFPTDSEGFAPFDEVFPFFAWLVAEVDFGRFKATGATITVDDGGPVPFGNPWSFGDQLTPQLQGNPDDPDSLVVTDSYRIEKGPVLTQAFQGFLGQTNVIQWSKESYVDDENGGISGIVMYAVTRAEDDPELAAAEPWEPGIPNVTVELYDESGTLLATTTTDSWDDSLPENCQYGSTGGAYSFRGDPRDCYDGMRNWNQVRPGVFDGGYAFGPEFDINDYDGTFPDWILPTTADPDIGNMAPGKYFVKVIPPEGYEIVKSQDKNVDFGDEFTPSPQLLPPTCVGETYTVPPFLSLFPGVEANRAGDTMNLCDKKEVILSAGQNAAADFFLFTEVPIAGHIIGFILDDTANEFDPTSPQFGEKYAPPFLPVSIRDFTGREIGRTVSDEFGVYNALVPSTYTQNLGKPSGISPNMLTACMNAKTLPDGSPDPLHNPQYSQFCYTLQYMPGSTTYLDTPVVPVAAFAGADQNPLDCQQPGGTPEIATVSVSGNGQSGGPYVRTNNVGQLIGTQSITIRSVGQQLVPNPNYDGNGGTEPKTILRDYGFGTIAGQIVLQDMHDESAPAQVLPVANWSDSVITVNLSTNISLGSRGAKQLTVVRADNIQSVVGVSLQVGLRPGASVREVAAGGSIQAAIDLAGTNDLILVAPGTYNEMVIMYKPVQLQGWGAGATVIDAIKTPAEKLVAWRAKAEGLVNSGAVSLIDGQALGFGGIEPTTFFSEEGAGILIAGKSAASNNDPATFQFSRNRNARVDGFTITGADTGGGVVVNGFADYVEISNLRVINNSAFFAGGIRIGHPMVVANDQYSDAQNNFVMIHHNDVSENGGLDGAGGGIALHTGSDSYQVTHNFVCGNFTGAGGAGIAHFGRSDRQNRRAAVPLIAYNTVLFNETFNQGLPANGGGIMIAGKPPLVAGTMSPGSGSVDVIGNLIQGNSAGAGDGAGIHLSRINGEDIRFRPNGNLRDFQYEVNIENNMVVNNVAALAGGGISMQDALGVHIRHNTIAHNDNTSTAGAAFSPGVPNSSNAQAGAGVVSYVHLDIPSGVTGGYSQPEMINNIVWENRKFNWVLNDADPDNIFGMLVPNIAGGADPVFDDLAVIGAPGNLTCNSCIQTGDTADVGFLFDYFNGNRQTTADNVEINTSIQAPPALDEGGNFIRLRYGPLTPVGDYHLTPGSPAVNAAATSSVDVDFDLDSRPAGSASDIGADEI